MLSGITGGVNTTVQIYSHSPEGAHSVRLSLNHFLSLVKKSMKATGNTSYLEKDTELQVF